MRDPEASGQAIRSRIIAFIPRLRRFCAALAGADKGDDIMQATVERALAKIDQWQPETSLESWMFRIAQNLFIDNRRAEARRGTHIGDELLEHMIGDDGRVQTEARSEVECALAAMARLPEEQRAVLALVAIEGCSYKEAAEIMEIPVGTVMSRIARARAAIDRDLHQRMEVPHAHD